MSASRTSFTGSIPDYYDRYLGPLIFEPYGGDLAQLVQVPAGASVLEIAAGTGIATRSLRDRVPADACIHVLDLNHPMLQVARQKFHPRNNMHFQCADAMRLPYPNASFDAVACQFGLMFFPDKLAALREANRVLKSGGVLAFSVWDSYEHNHLIRTVDNEFRQLFPDSRPDFYDTPHGYHSIDWLRGLLHEAGFGELHVTVLPKMSTCEAAQEVALGFVLGTPARLQIAERGVEPETIVAPVEAAVSHAHGSRPTRGKMQALLFKAYSSTKPLRW